MALTKTCMSFKRRVVWRTLCLRSSFVVTPARRSHSQVRPRSWQNLHTGDLPGEVLWEVIRMEHLVFRVRHLLHALEIDSFFLTFVFYR